MPPRAPLAATFPRRRTRRFRPGISSLLAMLYLVIFASLAIAFYEETNMSIQVSANEKRTVEALAAAEAGVKFVRYHLSALAVPPGLSAANAFEETYMQFAARIDGTANLHGGAVGYDGTTISVPETGYVTIDDRDGGHKFRVTITSDPTDGQLVIKSVGVSGSTPTSVPVSPAAIRSVAWRTDRNRVPSRIPASTPSHRSV